MNRIYTFDDLELDAGRREIRRAGELVAAEPKVLDLVFCLIEANGEIVESRAITDRLWPGVQVSRDALYRVVKEARAVLGDDGRRQSVIRTLSGRGFRWVAPVEIRSEPNPGIVRTPLDEVPALFAAGEVTEARRKAMEIARVSGEPSEAHRRARGLIWASDLVLHGQVDREWWQLTRAALEALGSAHPDLRAELEARQAYQLYWSRDHTRSRDALARARATSAETDAPHALAWVELVEHMLAEGPERLDERRRHALQAVEHARRAGVPQTELWAREQVVHDAMEAADLETVDAQAHAIDVLAEDHPLIWPERVGTMLRLHRGDLPAAERALLRELARHPDGGPHVFQYVGGPLLWLRFEQDRIGEVLPLLRGFVADGNELPIWRAALARGELAGGDVEAARREYEGLSAGGFGDVDADFVAPVTLAHLTELCVRFGDAEDAAWLEARLAPYAGRLIVAPRATFCMGPVDELLGQLAAVGGRDEEARTLLLRAEQQCLDTGAAPALERCRRSLRERVTR